MVKRLLVGFLTACSALLLTSSTALAADNWLGTWKLNTAKSKYSPGPAPRSQTLTFEKTADGIKLTSEGVSADGKPTHGTYVSKWDGKDVPYTGNPEADTAAPKKVDDNTYTNTWKKAGKVVANLKATVSADGKVLTVVGTGTDTTGRPVNNTVVFEKQ